MQIEANGDATAEYDELLRRDVLAVMRARGLTRRRLSDVFSHVESISLDLCLVKLLNWSDADEEKRLSEHLRQA